MAVDEKIDLRSLRYVLYARKSTEDETRQLRSIDDQIKDCKKLANELDLNIVDIIRETKSAKKPGLRPQFTRMISDIKSKKYDAILCWHPDRLSRNMLEGGEIINMLDEAVLRDIRFHSHQFSNDANGKMLLGMLFVFSKQYSDDLSTKVTRGVRGNFSDGKSSGSPKYGYDRDEVSGLYEPNEFFDLVQQAWKMRVEGESVESVTKFLIDGGYERKTKNKLRPRTIVPSVNAVSKIFQDPFYYGLLIQKEQTTDLRIVYDFQPMIDEKTYQEVQLLSYGRTKDKFTMKRATFYPLHGFVYCAICNSPKYMIVGKNKTGGGAHVLSYRCSNSTCTRKTKSFRAKHVFNSIYSMLDSFELSDEAYERYSKQLDSLTGFKVIEIKQKIQSRKAALTHIKHEIEERALNIGQIDKESPIYKANEKRINALLLQQRDLEEDIAKQEEKVANSNQIKLSKQEFLNLVKTASSKMRAGTAVEKDALCRILFLNLRVDNEKVTSYLWNEPFASLVKVTQLSSGGDERT